MPTQKPPIASIEISGTLLARNTLLNFIGQAATLLVGVATIPFIVRGLGTERFGLLSLAWVILGYFTVFDLGLGRATTKYVAEALGKGERERIAGIVWTAVTVQAAFGVVGCLVLASITPFLVEHVLNVPGAMIGEARSTFYLLSLAIPVVLVSGSFLGVLQAAQRFDLVNAVKVPSSALTFLLPLAGLIAGLQLPGIVVLILIIRVGALLALMGLTLSVYPTVTQFSPSFALFPRLFAFGTWVTVSAALIPIFIYLDRFLIGALVNMNAVAYYTVSHEFVTRLLIIPGSMMSVMFPAFSSLISSGDKRKLNATVMRSIKYLLTVMIPPAIVLLLFAEHIISVWLGATFAAEGSTALRLLSVAVVLNAVGYVPFALTQAVGRPDVLAKYYLVELPLYALVAFSLISQLGIAGAALGWCLRMVWSIPVFSILCARIAGIPLRAMSENGTSRSLMLAAGLLVIGLSFALWSDSGIASTVLFSGALVAAYVLIAWHVTFDRVDKEFVQEHMIKLRAFTVARIGL